MLCNEQINGSVTKTTESHADESNAISLRL